MVSKSKDLGTTVIRLHALASKLEGEGQYNVAKLARASADSMLRSSSYSIEFSSEREKLADAIIEIAEELIKFDLDANLIQALQVGASAMFEGRLTMIDETPHPYVCRTCGYSVMDLPLSNCPVCGARPRTFRRFLPVYWLEAMDPIEAMNWLRKTPEEVKNLIDGVSEDDLSKGSIAGEWSIRNVLSHLRDAQGVLDYRVHLLLDEDNPVIESKAVFEWASDEDDRPPTTVQIFETYLASRLKTLQKIEGIPLIDWWREGRHEEFGVVSVRQQVSYFTTHELTHLPQIEDLRSV